MFSVSLCIQRFSVCVRDNSIVSSEELPESTCDRDREKIDSTQPNQIIPLS